MKINLENKKIWREIPGYEGKYYVSNNGEVYSKIIMRILKPVFTSHGYHRVTLCGPAGSRKYYIHRLVAQCFIPNPENKAQVNHLNGSKTNNCIGNLQWVTCDENREHAIENGISGCLAKRIIRLNLKTNEVTLFDSMVKMVKEMYPDLNVKNSRQYGSIAYQIRNVLQGKRKSLKNYKFSYADK
jgi:hypothetical protein